MCVYICLHTCMHVCMSMCVPELVYTTYIPGTHRGHKRVSGSPGSLLPVSGSHELLVVGTGRQTWVLGQRSEEHLHNYNAKRSTAVDSGLRCQISTELKLLIRYGKFILSYELFKSFCGICFRSPGTRARSPPSPDFRAQHPQKSQVWQHAPVAPALGE